jgi:uncharacterized membrane protein
MEIIFGIGVSLLFLASLVLPWISRSRIRNLRNDVDFLKGQLRSIIFFLENSGLNIPDHIVAPPGSPRHQEEHVGPVDQPGIYFSDTDKSGMNPQAHDQAFLKDAASIAPEETGGRKKEKAGFEQQFGVRLPVWIGGIALALAGFFTVKYSIETGILSPAVRVVLGLVFGVGLLYAAGLVCSRENLANGSRIAQALSGAGIADLYICIFAATSLYDLVPSFIGFAGMAAVTATAIVLSLRHGMPVALLGMVGGLLTPAMVGSQDPQAPVLFIYLYCVVAGLMVVIRRHRWWLMAIPGMLGAFLWVCLWLFGQNFTPGDSVFLGLFLMAVSATVVVTSRHHDVGESSGTPGLFGLVSALNYLTLGGAMLLTGVIAAHAGFGLMEWSLFGLLSLGGVGLAFFNQKLYGLVPWISMAVNAVMLAVWNTSDPSIFALVISVFGVLYVGGGYLFQSRSERPLIWAGLAAVTSIGYYLLGYYELQNTALVSGIPLFWGALALVFAGLGTRVLREIMRDVPDSYPQKQSLLALYAATGTAFLSIALTVELPREFLSVAFAAQLLAIAWINTKVAVSSLRYIAGILACVFGLLLLPQILLLVQLTAYSLTEAELPLLDGVPIVDWPLFQLGVPAVCFVMGSYFLRAQKDDRLVHLLEVSAIALVGIMGYYLIRHAFHIDENIIFVKAGFFERGIITNSLFVYGLGCLWIGRRYLREAVTNGGLALCGVAVFRILYFDLVAYNPLWSAQMVGQLPLFNALLLAYGLPILLTWRAAVAFSQEGKLQWSRYAHGFMLLLAFILVSMNVRQVFHGTYLNGNEASNAEIYTYSVVWLLFGIALLFFGALKKDKMIRLISLAVMIFVAGKVFLFDASELEGLFRVFSFLALGLSLLGISWFYMRFVFGKRDAV